MTERFRSTSSFILTGASGAGKSTIAKGLEAIQDGPYKFERAKAVVTRKPRGPEDDDYIFVTDEEYDKRKKAGEFILETPSYNYRGAILPYTPPNPNTFPIYILTPDNSRRLQEVLLPRPRVVRIDRFALSAISSLKEGRPTMTEEDIELRNQQGMRDRAIAREIEDIGIGNDRDPSATISKLYEMLVKDIDRYKVSS